MPDYTWVYACFGDGDEISHIYHISLREEEFKYYNLILTNTATFCNRTAYLTDCTGDNYEVEDNISVVESRHLVRLSDYYTKVQSFVSGLSCHTKDLITKICVPVSIHQSNLTVKIKKIIYFIRRAKNIEQVTCMYKIIS